MIHYYTRDDVFRTTEGKCYVIRTIKRNVSEKNRDLIYQELFGEFRRFYSSEEEFFGRAIYGEFPIDDASLNVTYVTNLLTRTIYKGNLSDPSEKAVKIDLPMCGRKPGEACPLKETMKKFSIGSPTSFTSESTFPTRSFMFGNARNDIDSTRRSNAERQTFRRTLGDSFRSVTKT